MILLLRKIVDGKVANTALTQEMLSLLRDSDYEDRIPALLPKDAVVYHKTGNGPGNVHDVGIVVAGKAKYYIGIFTSDITDDEQASALEAKLSKLVFDFMR